MEKGLYSITMIKDLIICQNKQLLYYAQYDPYHNLIEIEFAIESVNKEGVVVILYRYYTRGEIYNIASPQYYLIPFKDYKYIRKNSQYL